MDGETGILLALAVAILGWLAKITHMLTGLSERYVPRAQIDARILKIEQQILLEKQDRRHDMSEIRGQLKTIIDKIDSKADK